jgi:peptide/nickel transport system substrate-binding protein
MLKLSPRTLARPFALGLLSAALLYSSAQAAEPAPVKDGGTLTVLSNSAINSLNPAIQSGVATAMPGSQMFASLLMADGQWHFHPYLADSWKKSDDGLTYTFKLNPKALFHDGQPITSKDVAFSIETVKQYHPFGKSMYTNLDKVETPDPHTVVVKFTKPNPAFLLEISTPALLPILPEHVYGKGNIRENPHNNAPIGSGPFKFSSYKPGQYLTVEKFKRFFLGAPHLDKITYVIIKDDNAATLAIQRGEIQYVAYPPFRLSEVARLAKNPKLVLTHKGYEGVGALVWLEFNMVEKGPLQNEKVRQAISYAIDRNFITQKLQRGQTQPVYGPIHYSSPYYDKNLNHYDVDLDKANKLLDEAGFPKKADGTRFELRLDYIPTNPDISQNVAEYLRPQLKKIGIKINLRPSPDFPTWAKRIANYEYDLDIDPVFNWGDPVIGVARTYMSTNVRKGVVWANMSGYKNPKVDQLLEQAAVENDPAKRKALYGEFQQIVNKELPVAWIATYPSNTIYAKDLRNLPDSIWGAFEPFNHVGWAK